MLLDTKQNSITSCFCEFRTGEHAAAPQVFGAASGVGRRGVKALPAQLLETLQLRCIYQMGTAGCKGTHNTKFLVLNTKRIFETSGY
jgi:hypothetical protein